MDGISQCGVGCMKVIRCFVNVYNGIYEFGYVVGEDGEYLIIRTDSGKRVRARRDYVIILNEEGK